MLRYEYPYVSFGKPGAKAPRRKARKVKQQVEFRIISSVEKVQDIRTGIARAQKRYHIDFTAPNFVVGDTLIVGVVTYKSERAERRFKRMLRWLERAAYVQSIRLSGLISMSARERLGIPEETQDEELAQEAA